MFVQLQDRWDFTAEGAEVRRHMEFPCIGLNDQAPADSLEPDPVDTERDDEDARERRVCNYVRRYPFPIAAVSAGKVKAEKGANGGSFADQGSFASTSDRAAAAAAALARDNA